MAEHILTEEWRPVVGFEAYYRVSNLGRVWSIRANRPLTTYLNDRGYLAVQFSVKMKHRTMRVHTLVLTAFVGPRPDVHECNHKDGNKANAALLNLEWCTASQNVNHSYQLGLKKKMFGEANAISKLTQSQVDMIRLLQGYIGGTKLSEALGISPATIYDIWKNRSWSNEKECVA